MTDNHAGGSGTVGTGLVVHALADGYTLPRSPTSHAINPNFVTKLPYDTHCDFTWAKVTQAAGLNVP